MKIDRDEMLRYMGFRGQALSRENLEVFSRAEELCISAISPKTVVKEYEIDHSTMQLAGTNVILQGQDIARHLAGCNRVYLIAATLGLGLDKLVGRLMREDPVLGVAVDSAAVCAIESVLDDLCENLAEKCGKKLTSRFSCGYGDFPLEQQPDFIRLLDMNRRLGVYLGAGNIMTPQKSVTAVVGICESSRDFGDNLKCGGKCAECALKDCAYRAK